MSRIRFEPAAAADDAALRRLMAENEMEGEIAVSFRREPCFFHGSEVQGPFHQVLVARDTETGQVIGVGTRAVRPGFLNGEPNKAGISLIRANVPSACEALPSFEWLFRFPSEI